MGNSKYPADKPRTHVEIERDALALRRALGFDLAGRLPGEKIFGSLGNYSVLAHGRWIRLTYEVAKLEQGLEAEARYEPDTDEIVVCLTPQTYEGLEKDLPRPRFSLFHEIGHAVEHPNELVRLARIPRHTAALHRGLYRDIRPFRDCEWQANAFAAALSMPARGLQTLREEGRLTVAEIVGTFRMSQESATYRLSTFMSKGRELLKVK